MIKVNEDSKSAGGPDDMPSLGEMKERAIAVTTRIVDELIGSYYLDISSASREEDLEPKISHLIFAAMTAGFKFK